MSLTQLETLAESGLEQEARDVLAALLGAAATVFGPVLARTLEEFEYEIFALGDGARDLDRQKLYFNTVRDARRARDELLPRITQLLEHALARKPSQAALPAHAVEGRLFPAEATILGEMATAAATKVERPLAPLAQRYAQVIGASEQDAASFAIGPDQLLEVLREGATEFTQLPEHRVLLYRVLDRHWLDALRDFYDLASRVLSASGTYAAPPREPAAAPAPPASSAQASPAQASAPGEATQPVPAPPPGAAPPLPSAAAPPQARAPDEPSAHEQPARESASAARVGPAPVRATEATSPVVPLPARFLRDGAPDLSGFSEPLIGWPLIGLVATEQAPLGESTEAELRDQYFRARDTLIQRRQAARNDATSASGAQSQSVANTDDVQLVLSVMSLGTTASAPGPHVLSRSLVHLKQDLVNQLRQFTPDGKPPRLSDADSTTFELVGRLFDELAEAAQSDVNALALLRELRMPILRVALADKRFFTHAQHSARVLVGVVLEQILYWHESEQDTAIAMVRLEDIVERMAGYKGSNQLFDEIVHEYRAHQEMAARKAELLEKRQVEAAAGRERLQLARREAESAVAQSLTHGDPPPLVRQLLEHDWVRLLALTNLGEGPTSLSYRNRLAVAGRLIELFDRAHHSSPAHRDEHDFLTREIELGLAKVGYPEDESRRLTARLFGHDPEHADPRVLLRAPPKENATAPAPPPVQLPHVGARDRQIQAQLGARARGAWLDFVIGSDGTCARRKLAWIDHLGEQCLLLNLRGARVGEPALAWIAQEIRSGRARVVARESENIVDRALRAAYRSASQQSTPASASKRA